MTLTQHLNQMKLSAFVAIAAVIGGSFLIPNPAEARNGWIRAADTSDGTTFYVKPVKRNGPYVHYLQRSSNHQFEYENIADCSAWRWRNAEKDEWIPVLPDSIGETVITRVCR